MIIGIGTPNTSNRIDRILALLGEMILIALCFALDVDAIALPSAIGCGQAGCESTHQKRGE